MCQKIAFLALMILISGCSTDAQIKYERYKEGALLPPSSLKFYLHESNVTLTKAKTTDDLQKASSSDAKENCEKGINGKDYRSWSKCFNGVNAVATIATPDSESSLYVAIPDNNDSLGYITTAITGTEIPSQRYTYSQITVQYKNNVPTAIQNGATGGAAGFSVGGPGGAILGVFIGLAAPIFDIAAVSKIAAVQTPVPNETTTQTKITLNDLLCSPDAEFNASDFKKIKTISLPLPITIAASKAGLASNENLRIMNLPKGPGDVHGGCWNKLPNGSRIGSAISRVLDDTKVYPPRPVESGDGWLYRIVDGTTRGDTLLSDETMAEAYFSDSAAKNTFPYSSCRAVTIEVLWWEELSTYIEDFNQGKNTPPHVVKLQSVSAYPKIVKLAQIKKGGAINFRPDCDATVSMTPDLSYSAIINATTSAVQTISKAQNDWKDSKKQ